MKTIVNILLIALIGEILSQCKKDDDPFVIIPDNNFLNALIEVGVDNNGDSIISAGEAAGVTFLDVHLHNISDLKGIDAFINLDTLYCGLNQLPNLDVSNNHELVYLECQSNLLTSLDVSNNPELHWINCGYNSLTKLDVSNIPLLDTLYCYYNSLTSLDFSSNPALKYLHCQTNLLTSLNVTHNPELTVLMCAGNLLTSLDVSNNPKLLSLYCGPNFLTSLDVSNNTALKELVIGSNPSLSKVCVWTMPFPPGGVFVWTDSQTVYYTMTCN